MPVRMIPMLPCTSIDEMAEFGQLLGLQVTYRQVRPNPYLAMEGADGLVLHYFAIPDLAPEDSYSTCGVMVEDPGRLFEDFAAGLRARYGKLPMTGYPGSPGPGGGRMPRTGRVQPGRSGGEWIRVMASKPPSSEGPPSADPLTRALDNAVVLADSHGDVAQARKIMARALARQHPDADPLARAEAEAFLAELRDRSEPLTGQPGD